MPVTLSASLTCRRICAPVRNFTALLFLGVGAATAAVVEVAGYITHPNSAIGIGNTASLTANATFGWQTSNCAIPVNTNSFAFSFDNGNGNSLYYTGQISGSGSVNIEGGGSVPVRIGGSVGNTYTGNTAALKGAVSLEKTSGNALGGDILVNSPASLVWVASSQINDLSNVTLASGAFLDLDGRSETINELRLVSGSMVKTGAGGVISVSKLFLNGVEQAPVGKGPGDNFVLGSGYINVANSGPPVAANLPAAPSGPGPAASDTTIHPATFNKLDWADSNFAASYDVYLWTGTNPKPPVPTATVTFSEYIPPAGVASLTTFHWQIVATNQLGETSGPEWMFTTLDRGSVSGEIADPNDWIGVGNSATLAGDTTFGWKTSTCAIPAALNGFDLTLNSGGGNNYNYTGSITGSGGLNLEMAGFQSSLWNNPMRLGGFSGNSYSGPTMVNFGTVSLEKSSGDALCGPITVGSRSNTARLVWNGDHQIADQSDVMMLAFDAASAGYPGRETFLNLNGHVDSINSLSLEGGNQVQTGNGGVLTARSLAINGVPMGAGTYTSANHDFVTGTGQVVITTGGVSGFDSWATAQGLTGSAAAFGADADDDGIPNAIEFVTGGHPDAGGTGAPATMSTDSDDFRFTFNRTSESSYLKPVVETSDTLAGSWTERLDPGNATIEVAPGSGFETVTVAVPRAGHDRLFARLKVSSTDVPGLISPRITASPVDTVSANGGNFTLSAEAGGNLTVAWQWYHDGIAIPGATGSTYSVSGAGASRQGAYQAIASNANGAAVSTVAQVLITTAPGEGGLALIPWPQEIQLGSGDLTFAAGTRIVATNASLIGVANTLAGEIAAAYARVLPVVTTAPAEGDIVLTVDGGLEGEAHTISVDTRALVHGRDPFAVSLGTATLLQAMKLNDGQLACPRFSIQDSPAVGLRALMLDLARFDHSLESLLQAVDLCRLYKINYLHLHFNDDQAYSFPSTAYPLLNNTTRDRGRKVYTLGEMEALEAYAVARGVHIMPELEVPGHNALMLAAYPDLFRINYPYDPNSSDPDYPKWVPSSSINIAKADVRLAVRTLIGEMCAVFKSTPYIHLGCDEVDWAWSEHSPDFQAVFTEWGFNRADPRENVQLAFAKFISLARGYAAEFGKKSIVWENHAMFDSPEVPASTDILVMPFDSYNPGSFAGAGFKLVNAAWSPLYVVGDLRKPVKAVYDWNRSIFGQYSGECDEYVSHTVNPQEVVGTQLTTFEQEEDMEMMSTRRRLAAMAERSWNPAAGATYENFLIRLDATDGLLDTLLSPVRIAYSGLHDPDDRMFGSSATAVMSLTPAYAGQGLTIRYTTNRTDVTSASPVYTSPHTVTATGYFRAAAFYSSGQRVGRMVREMHRKELEMKPNLAAGKPVTASSGTNAAKAVDLRHCQGWTTEVSASRPAGETLTVDLQSVRNVNRVSILFAQYATYYYRVEISQDATGWTTVVDASATGVEGNRAGFIHPVSPATARYVKLTLYPHAGSNGEKSVREILVTETGN